MICIDSRWEVLLAPRRKRRCLHLLALGCGYRVSEIADTLVCRQRYLHEVFLRDIGLPPKHWLRLERMVVSRRMLVGGRSSEAVAATLAFGSAAIFRREFKGFHGVAPGRYQLEQWRLPVTGARTRPTGGERKNGRSMIENRRGGS